MARATRSGNKQDDTLIETKSTDVPLPFSPGKQKGLSGQVKKRKRSSNAENEDQPAAKQLRADSLIKGEDSLETDVTKERPVEVKGAGDVPILPEDAQRILDILEMVDTQGLLDRVFPLPADPAATLDPQSSSQSNTYSFRTLLQESQRHPLRVLKSAVQPLLPVFTHPRSRPSAPAAQQLKFCNLALSLLDQCSFHSSPASFHVESLLPDPVNHLFSDSEGTSTSRSSISRKRKYALMQKLPTGEWWTSVDTEGVSTDGRELKDLPTAQAELVAILPSASSSSGVSSSVPTLGTYSKRKLAKKAFDTGPRPVFTGAFLDYGPYASFAPTFDQDSAEVGQVRLGEVLWEEEKKRRLDRLRSVTSKSGSVDDIRMDDESSEVEDVTDDEKRKLVERTLSVPEETLHDLLPPEEVASIKAALGTLELEQAVQELLDRNTKALKRLEELQRRRLASGSTKVEMNSEEWDVAQGITNSLATLASLRPRSSGSTLPPLIPSAAALHHLHRTLPTGPSEGWYGTLQSNRPTTALRDDTTIHLKTNHIPAAAVAAASTATPAIATPATPAYQNSSLRPGATTPATTSSAATGYAGAYAYSGYGNTQYRTAGYNYAPASTNAYYPNAYGQSASTAAPATPGASTSGQQQQQYTAASGTNPYSYTSSWYNYTHQQQQQQQQQPSQSGTAPGTPQAGQTTPSYNAFFNSQSQRAVANTLATTVATTAGAKGYTPTWAGSTAAAGSGTSGYTPTLPKIGSTSGNGATPGTPTAGAGQYPGYNYAPYQSHLAQTQAGQR